MSVDKFGLKKEFCLTKCTNGYFYDNFYQIRCYIDRKIRYTQYFREVLYKTELVEVLSYSLRNNLDKSYYVPSYHILPYNISKTKLERYLGIK